MNHITNLKFSFFFYLILFTILIGCGVDKPAEIVEAEKNLPDQIDFNFHVKPILSDRCFACHGPDKNKQEAGLHLDTEEGAYAALTENPGKYAIVKGNLAKSEVYHRIITEDPELLMPPPESNLTLTPEEKATIVKWIEQGAKYKPHWSFIKPEKHPLPEVKNEDWVANEIDQFVLNKLEANGLNPTEKAKRETLIRRVTFDLTGLPPTIEEIDNFLNDKSENAFEKVVDRLLASPHYGERMAVDWLDLARYADTHGYQDDGMRNMYPWRDWVIKSFNENLPFDKFLTWQMAGDMLPNPTREQILATGFNRNHMQSQEGGIVAEEYRVEYVADRTNTLGKAFLGLTLECSRCHDHKYDPISQKEYFQLFSFFNNVNEYGQIPYIGEASPTIILTTEAADSALAFIQENIKSEEEKLAEENYKEGFSRWMADSQENNQNKSIKIKGLIGDYPLDGFKKADKKFWLENKQSSKFKGKIEGYEEDHPKVTAGKFNEGFQLVGDSYLGFGKEIGEFDRHMPFSMSIWVKTLSDKLEGPILSRSGGLFDGNRGYDLMLNKDGTLYASLNHTFPDNSIAVQTKKSIPSKEWVQLTITYDGSSKASGIKIFANGELMPSAIQVDNLQSSILYYGKGKRNWYGGQLSVGKRFEETLDSAIVDEYKIFNRQLSRIEVKALFDENINLNAYLDKPDTKSDLLEYYLLALDNSYENNFKKLTELRGEENEIYTNQEEVMVMKELPEPRKSFILNRGQYDAPTDEVFPGTPAYILPFPEELPKNRLGLAEWLLHEDNPLTARVIVNRYWQMYFGQGLVASSDDFGNQGDLPSHPELLDWLAIQFRDKNWDIKAIQKLIVMSNTYQQSSIASAELMEIDPANKLLARGPSYRMSAEMIRDNALAASGLLVRTIGGPSVKPYQPPGLWKQLATRNATEYVQQHGDNLYRRGMYTIWKRTSPPPSMISFDAAERSFCTVKRQKTSTPLQSLVLLNDPQYVEAARVLAENALMQGGDDIEDQITYAFRMLTSKMPDEKQLKLLKRLFQEEFAELSKYPEEAQKLRSVGEYQSEQSLDPVKVGAFTLVTNTLINFDEAVFKR
ncbi:DUF1553 domain-containing protein [Flexithrix dorotheae]|uniref:DUF1553 domain-containing protein n=1 Tax=Flexithrix dorotheae TaxID=70993 RepID=UPI000381FAC1|nr:DUF1553 domain-containing protein [Flexithrix dorotheae]